ncbi:MAG: hypothetical protein VKN33_08700 [Candidatus Sericytochromatia bacterium]|nr:hypothetical protein [Candidatus Sericytochromatia bacterium]
MPPAPLIPWQAWQYCWKILSPTAFGVSVEGNVSEADMGAEMLSEAAVCSGSLGESDALQPD